ncbi:hypothetical protein EYV94_24415 [Puteibacter caeruleilacunae]|nr:hypothetical protein EYV94_24415 [Puteibacter caeruleilacunae]
MFSTLSFGQNEFIETLGNRLDSVYLRSPLEKVYVQTDRNQYFPSDTLWFKATLTESRSMKFWNSSKMLHLHLFDHDGKRVNKENTYVVLGEAQGCFVLPEEEGWYKLVAATNWNYNTPQNRFFTKDILIQKPLSKASFKMNFAKGNYQTGEDVEVEVDLLDGEDVRQERIPFTYRLNQGERILDEGEAFTKGKGMKGLKLSLEEANDTLPVSLTLESKDPTIHTKMMAFIPGTTTDFDVNFFPEGGELVYRVPGMIGFKAVDAYGNPLDVDVVVTDKDGNTWAKGQSSFNGMGKFKLTCLPGKELIAKVTSKRYGEKIVPLPQPVEKGFVMKVKDITAEYIRLYVMQNISPEEQYSLVVSQRDEMIYSMTGNYKDFGNFKLPLKDLKAGVATITVFDRENRPRAERVVFVKPQQRMHVKIEGVRSIYQPRDKVAMNIQVTDEDGNPLQASLSVAVLDSLMYKNDRVEPSNIFSYLNLETEVKGRVHDVDYLFSEEPGASEALDLVMMTQGWRRYKWEELIDDAVKPTNRLYDDFIRGHVIRNWSKKPVPNAAISLLTFGNSGVGLNLFNTDSTGRFKMLPDFQDFNVLKMIFSAQKDKGKGKVRLRVTSNEADSLMLSLRNEYKGLSYEMVEAPYAPLNEREIHQKIEADDQVMINSDYLIEEVSVIGEKIDKPESVERGVYTSFSSYSKKGSDLSPASDFEGILRQVLPFFIVDTDSNVVYMNRGRDQVFGNSEKKPILFVVDDFAMGSDLSAVDHLTSDAIDEIFVMTDGATAQFGMEGQGGVVIIYTRDDYVQESTSENISSPIVFAPIKEFYAPKYDTPLMKSLATRDMRSTVYWKPMLVTDEEGKATLEYYNGDIKNKKIICIEGLSYTGLPGYGIFTYNVMF